MRLKIYTCLTIDSDIFALEDLGNYISLEPKLKLLKTYVDPFIALKDIEQQMLFVDFIFIDIKLPEMYGVELAAILRLKTANLIFTTANSNCAINFYDLEADGFLLKPILQIKFTQTIKRLLPLPERSISESLTDFIFVKSKDHRNRFIKIKLGDIIAIEAQARTTKIYTLFEIIYSSSNLLETSKLLTPEMGFPQVHRSFIVAEIHIKAIERTYLILATNLKIKIGRTYCDFYEKTINNK